MTTITLSANAAISAWQVSTDNTTVSTGTGERLTGIAAAAYLFGQALRTVDGSVFGVAGQARLGRQQAAFEFPAGSGQRVSLNEIADALRYKFDCDPLIEFSSDLGVPNYSLADINELLRRLSAEYAGRFTFDALTLRKVSESVSPLTELDGTSADLLLSDLLTDAQRQALVDLATRLKTVAQEWVAGLGSASDPLATLLRGETLAQGLDLSTTSSTAVPGQTLTVTAIIQQAGTALGINFADRFPELFSSGRLHLQDVNLLLAAAREAMPGQVNNLADYAPAQGLTRAGVAYTGRSALMVHVADVISGLTVLSGTLPPRIGWNDTVFTDPFAPSGTKLSANTLAARFASVGFDPFAYLGSPRPDYLTLADLNAFLTQLNTKLSLTGAAAYAPIAFQFKDDYGNNLRPDEAYLNQVMRVLSTAGSSAQLANVWSLSYSSTLRPPIGTFSSSNAWDSRASTTNYWAWSGALGAAGAATNISAGLSALSSVIPSPQAGVVYLRQVSGGAAGAYPSGFGAFTWNGSAFSALSSVNGLTVNKDNIDAIADGWQADEKAVDGIEQVAWIPIDRAIPNSDSAWGQKILSNPTLIRGWPLYESLYYFGRDPATTVGGIQFGEPPERVHGAHDVGGLSRSTFASFTAMDAALVAGGQTMLSNPLVAPFWPPAVSEIQYLDADGQAVQTLVAGQTYRAVVRLAGLWPGSTSLSGTRPPTGNGFLRHLNLSSWVADLPAPPNADRTTWGPAAYASVTWDAAKASYTGNNSYLPDPNTVGPAYLWTDVSTADATAAQATFVAQASGPAQGTVSITLPDAPWARWNSAFAGDFLAEAPLIPSVLASGFDPGVPLQLSNLRLLGWSSASLPGPAPVGLALSQAIFRDPRGSNAALTLEQVSRVLARDFAGAADLGSDGDGALNLVNWFMGTGAAFSGSARGWPAAYGTADQAATAYQALADGATPPVVGLGAWNDPSGSKPLSEWSVKAAMLSLWWGLNSVINVRGNVTPGVTTPPALAWAGGFQPVAAGAAQMGVVASAALSAQSLMSTLTASGATLTAPLTSAQQSAFAAMFTSPRAAAVSAPLAGELAELRRAFKDRTGASLRLVDVVGLDTGGRRQLVSAAQALQSGLLDEALLQRLAFGERIGWDEPVFFDGQGQAVSLSTLVGGRDSSLAQRLLARMPQLADLGMRYDDLRRVLATAASLDSSTDPMALNDPARAVLAVDGVTYEGGAAVLLRIAAALRSVATGAYASVALDAGARVFDDPIRPGSGLRWSLNDLDQLARRSAGYTALTAPARLYDIHLDAIVRQLELSAGKVSTVVLSSNRVPDAALSWFAKQLVSTEPTMLLLANADLPSFSSGGTTKSFRALVEDVQRLFGAELAPRLEALGVLQDGPGLTLLNVAALNGFLDWQKARDASVTTSAIAISPAPTVAQTTTVAAYRAAVVPLQEAARELRALKAALDPWVPIPVTATTAQWRAAQQQLASQCIELGTTAQSALGVTALAAVRSLASGQALPADSPAERASVQAQLAAALTAVQVQLQDLSTGLGVTALDLGNLMGDWTFASDDASLVTTQRQQLAAVDTSRAALRQAWQNPLVLDDGSVRPDVSALTADTPARRVSGAQALATLVAQALASLNPVGAAATTIDPDAALFADPAAWATRNVRAALSGTDGAPRISLRQLAARGQAALGFDLLTEFAPASGSWTVARLGGAIGVFNDALGFNAAAPYAGALAASAVGSAQALRDRIVRADTAELVVPVPLREPLVALLNKLEQLTAADLAPGGRAALDADGFFATTALLFRSAPTVAPADQRFTDLVAAGSGASPTLSTLLSRMGIVIGSRVNARGLNSLLDVMRAESPEAVRTRPLVLPAAVQALGASAAVTLDQFEALKQQDTNSRQLLPQFQTLLGQWASQLNKPASEVASQWTSWKASMQATLDQIDATDVALPVSRTTVDALLSVSTPPVAPTITTAGLTALRARVQAGADRAYTGYQNLWNYANSLPAWNANRNTARSEATNVYDAIYLPFDRARGTIDYMLSRLAQTPPPSSEQLIADATGWVRGQWTTYYSGGRTDWYGVPALVSPWNLDVNRQLYEDAGSPSWDFMGWLTQFDIPSDWADSAANRRIPGVFPNDQAYSYIDVDQWRAAGYPGATRFLNTDFAPSPGRTAWSDFQTAVDSAPAALDAALRTAGLGFDWRELAERLSIRSRTVDLPNGAMTTWYQVAHALLEADPTRLPADGSGADRVLFELPPGSGQRHSIANLRRLLNEQIGQAGFDVFGAISVDIDFARFSDRDRTRLLAAIGRAMPEVALALGGNLPSGTGSVDAAVVARMAERLSQQIDRGDPARARVQAQPISTESEIRKQLSTGGEVYVDRFGGFFLNGVRTRPMDLGVVTRYLVQDKLSAEYKVLMDDMNERNNQITAARSLVETLTGIVNGDYPKPAGNSDSNDTYWKEQVLGPKLTQLQATLGSTDILNELTGGKYSFVNATTWLDGSGVGVIVDITVRDDLKALLNTLISNKIRDGDLSQSKLQALTAQMQNNIEAMSALIKVFNEATKTLAQALR